jgi:hypothetical protein
VRRAIDRYPEAALGFAAVAAADYLAIGLLPHQAPTPSRRRIPPNPKNSVPDRSCIHTCALASEPAHWLVGKQPKRLVGRRKFYAECSRCLACVGLLLLVLEHEQRVGELLRLIK